MNIVGHCPHCGAPIYGPEYVPDSCRGQGVEVLAYACSCRHRTTPQAVPSSEAGSIGAALAFATVVFGILSAVALAHWW